MVMRYRGLGEPEVKTPSFYALPEELRRKIYRPKDEGLPSILTATEAQQAGWNLSDMGEGWEDYMVKLSPDTTKDGGVGYSILTPEGYEYFEDNTVKLPDGKTFTVEEWTNFQIAAAMPGAMPVGGEGYYTPEAWLPTEAPAIEAPPEDISKLVTAVFPKMGEGWRPPYGLTQKEFEDLERQGLTTYFPLYEKYTKEPAEILTGLYAELETEEGQDRFLAEIVKRGRTPETEQLLKALNVPDYLVGHIFGEAPELLPSEKYAEMEGRLASFAQSFVGYERLTPQAVENYLKPLGYSDEDIYRYQSGKAVEEQNAFEGLYHSLYEGGIELAESSKGGINVWRLGLLSTSFVLTDEEIDAMVTEYMRPLRLLPKAEYEAKEAQYREFLREDAERLAKWYSESGIGSLLTSERDKLRRIMAENVAKHEDWLLKHPELQPPPEYMQDATQNLSLLKDPGYWAYKIGSTAPFSIAVMGVVLGGTFLTKNPFIGLAAGTAFATPSQTYNLYQDLLASGAPEGEAARIAIPVGTLIASVEAITDLPLLSAISPAFSLLSANIKKAVIRETVLSLLKKRVKTFTTVEIVEALEEVTQNAIQNAFVSTYDVDRKMFEGTWDTIISTLIATSPMAIFGGAMSTRHVNPSESMLISAEEKAKRGWEQDKLTGEWYKPEKLVDTFKTIFEGHEEGGLSFEQASEKTLNELAMTPEGAEAIGEAARKIEAGEVLETAIPISRAELTEKIAKMEQIARETETTPEEHFGVAYTGAKEELARLEGEAVTPTISTGVAAQTWTEAGIQKGLFGEEKEVRPRAKGEIVQISMEDQLKLEQARQAAKVEENKTLREETAQKQAEIKSIEEWLETDLVATYKGTYITAPPKIRKGETPEAFAKRAARSKLTHEVSLTAVLTPAGEFPETLTKKQANLLRMEPPGTAIPASVLTKEGRVKWEYVVDTLVDHFKEANAGISTEQDLIDRIEFIAKQKARLAELKADIKRAGAEAVAPSAEVAPSPLLTIPEETTLPMPDDVTVSQDRVVKPPPPPEVPPPPEPPPTHPPQPAPIENNRLVMPDLQSSQQVVDM